MPRFSQKSISKLSSCHPDLQALFFEVIKYFDCTILEGFRDEQAQEAAFKAGNTTLHWPNGNHNRRPSKAVDVSPYPIDWKNNQRFFWFAGYVLATAEQLRLKGKMTYHVRYGGDWNRNFDITDEKGLRDLVHFELVI